MNYDYETLFLTRVTNDFSLALGVMKSETELMTSKSGQVKLHMSCNGLNSNHVIDHNTHTPSITFRHLPPNSARFSYAIEVALFISMQLSTDAVSDLRKVWVLIRLWKQPSAQACM